MKTAQDRLSRRCHENPRVEWGKRSLRRRLLVESESHHPVGPRRGDEGSSSSASENGFSIEVCECREAEELDMPLIVSEESSELGESYSPSRLFAAANNEPPELARGRRAGCNGTWYGIIQMSTRSPTRPLPVFLSVRNFWWWSWGKACKSALATMAGYLRLVWLKNI